jgi:hypothetical protein
MVWDNATNYNIQKLQKMQNRAARILTGSSYDVLSKELLRQLNWETLEERRGNKKELLMYKVKNGIAPDSIGNLFNICDNQNYCLRSNLNNFKLDKPNRNFLKKSISYSGAKCWNDLTNDLKSKTMGIKRFRVIVGGAD